MYVSNVTAYPVSQQLVLAGFLQSNVPPVSAFVTDVRLDNAISANWYIVMGVLAAPSAGATSVAYYVNYYVTP